MEAELRRRLSGVQLVCEADLPDAFVDQAEAVVRPLLTGYGHEKLARLQPATLVTYFVRRRAAVCTRTEMWAPLGVADHRQEAGEAFLRSLSTTTTAGSWCPKPATDSALRA